MKQTARTYIIAIWTLLLGAPAIAQQATGFTHMNVPPTQRVVRVQILNGVLISKGSVSDSEATAGDLLDFVMDTAANATIVDPQVGRFLGGKGAIGERLQDKTLRLAGAQITHRAVVVLPLTGWERETGEHLSGIAGSDLFDHLAARIDYVNQQLTLVVPQSCSPSDDSIRLKVIGGLPFLEAGIETASGLVEGLFLIDTGQAGSGLVFTSEFLAAHPEIIAKAAKVQLPDFDAKGVVKTTDFFRVASLKLGKYAVKSVVASIAPPAAGGAGARLAGVIGGGVLGHFDVLVDVPQNSIVLTPNAHYGAPFEADMSGLLLLSGEDGERSGEGGYTVAAIAEKSPAAEAGLHTGDRIVEIAGPTGAKAMSMEQIRSVFKSGPGTRVLVTVDRSGKKVQVTLTLRRAV